MGGHMIRAALGLCALSFLLYYTTSPGLPRLHVGHGAGKVVNKTSPPLSDSLEAITSRWGTRVTALTEQHLQPFASPREKHPFVFFHLRKAGGSTWRSKILAAVGRTPAWIPCLKNANCREYIPPSLQNFAVYAGHLYYVDFENRRYNFDRVEGKPNNPAEHNAPDAPNQFDCMLQVRPTVERVVSCWNYRFCQELKCEQVGGLAQAHNLTAQQWDYHLPRLHSQYLEGCNNENVRVLGSLADERMVNTLTSSSPPSALTYTLSTTTQAHQLDFVDSAFLTHELERIYNRMSKCVILRTGHDDANAVILQHYIPWLAPPPPSTIDSDGKQRDQERVVMNRGTIKAQNLTAGSVEVILRHNQMDEAIYQFAVQLSMEQYRLASLALQDKNGNDNNAYGDLPSDTVYMTAPSEPTEAILAIKLQNDVQVKFFNNSAMTKSVKGISAILEEEEGIQGVYEAYLSLRPWAFRSDLWRLMILWAYGGIYVDADLLVREPFVYWATLNQEEEMATCVDLEGKATSVDSTETTAVFFQAMLSAKKGSPLLLKAINFIVGTIKNRGYGIEGFEATDLSITGPVALGYALRENYHQVRTSCRLHKPEGCVVTECAEVRGYAPVTASKPWEGGVARRVLAENDHSIREMLGNDLADESLYAKFFTNKSVYCDEEGPSCKYW